MTSLNILIAMGNLTLFPSPICLLCFEMKGEVTGQKYKYHNNVIHTDTF